MMNTTASGLGDGLRPDRPIAGCTGRGWRTMVGSALSGHRSRPCGRMSREPAGLGRNSREDDRRCHVHERSGSHRLVALFSTGFALAVAQDGGNDRTQAGRPAAAAARQAASRPPMDMQQLLLSTGKARAQSSRRSSSTSTASTRTRRGATKSTIVGHAAFKNPAARLSRLPQGQAARTGRPERQEEEEAGPGQEKQPARFDAVRDDRLHGPEVWHYRYDVKQIFIFPLDKDQRKRALEEGPLPFLFNMKAADAKQRYEMVLQGEDDKEYLVKIKPLLKEDKDDLQHGWVYLDKEFLLPTRIVLIAPDGKSSQGFRPLADQGEQAGEPTLLRRREPRANRWKVERNPGEQARGPATSSTRRSLRTSRPAARRAQR